MVIMRKVASKTKKAAPQQEIAKVAYQLFLNRGCAHGYDMEDWLKAEKIVSSKRKKS